MPQSAVPSRGADTEGTLVAFVVATGIECSAPVIAGGIRRDELVLTAHVDHVEEDLDLVVELGITHLRYGIPFHLVAADGQAFVEAIFLNSHQKFKIIRAPPLRFAHSKARKLKQISPLQNGTINQIWKLIGQHVGQYGRI